MDKTFYFSKAVLPTPYNLTFHLQQRGYRQAQPGCINDKHLELDEVDCRWLEYKHLLADLTQRYCPEVMPKTWHIHDGNVESVLNEVNRLRLPPQENIWILKPSMLNNGEGICLFSDVHDIWRHYQSSDRLGGDHVLQQYVVNPHCLQGHKYTIRMLVVITNCMGVFLYCHGYFNIARSRYRADDWQCLDCHFTNEHLPLQATGSHCQIPTSHHPKFNLVYPGLRQIVCDVVAGFSQQMPSLLSGHDAHPAMGLFGFDFIVDAALRPWLLEVNHGPCFPVHAQHSLQKPLYHLFWQNIIEFILEPMCERQEVNCQRVTNNLDCLLS